MIKQFKCVQCGNVRPQTDMVRENWWDKAICSSCHEINKEEAKAQYEAVKYDSEKVLRERYGAFSNDEIVHQRSYDKSKEIYARVCMEVDQRHREKKEKESFVGVNFVDVNDLFVFDNGKLYNYCDMQNKMLTMV